MVYLNSLDDLDKLVFYLQSRSSGDLTGNWPSKGRRWMYSLTQYYPKNVLLPRIPGAECYNVLVGSHKALDTEIYATKELMKEGKIGKVTIGSLIHHYPNFWEFDYESLKEKEPS